MRFFRLLGRVLLVPFQVIFEIIWGIIKLFFKAVWWFLKKLWGFLRTGSLKEILFKTGGVLLVVAMVFRFLGFIDIAPAFVILALFPFGILALIKAGETIAKV